MLNYESCNGRQLPDKDSAVMRGVSAWLASCLPHHQNPGLHRPAGPLDASNDGERAKRLLEGVGDRGLERLAQ